MSSAMPAAFWSAMSMTTTSASSFSAIPRATVAPTFPAPPTTVTFRFIPLSFVEASPPRRTRRTQRVELAVVAGFLDVFDDRVRELRRLQLLGALHLSRKIVGDLLLRDR